MLLRSGAAVRLLPILLRSALGLDADFTDAARKRNHCWEICKDLFGATVAPHPHGARRATVDPSPYHMKAAYSVLGIRSHCDPIGVEGEQQKGPADH